MFGPVLHVVRWRADALDALIDDIAANGYGLTLGIHTRIDATAEHIVARLANGNVYVNRNMIGAVVGTQPFGGSGLSGTGPKAGGPNYLRRFATEQVVTVNTRRRAAMRACWRKANRRALHCGLFAPRCKNPPANITFLSFINARGAFKPHSVELRHDDAR